MTAASELPWVVTDKQSSLPKEVGQRLLDLAKSARLGTQAEIASELGVHVKTVERLSSGESSAKFGRRFRAYLMKKGVKEAALLSLDPDAPSVPETGDVPYSEEEWLRIGRVLHEHAKPEWFTAEYTKLRKLADAYEIQVRDMREMGK